MTAISVTKARENPYQDKVSTAQSLFGILPKDADIEVSKEESWQLNNENPCRYQCNNRCAYEPGAVQGDSDFIMNTVHKYK